jgi:hypothetical protein
VRRLLRLCRPAAARIAATSSGGSSRP